MEMGGSKNKLNWILRWWCESEISFSDWLNVCLSTSLRGSIFARPPFLKSFCIAGSSDLRRFFSVV